MRELRASVVLATRGRPELLRSSLPALAAAVEAVGDAELVVVEQGAPAAARLCDELAVPVVLVPDTGTGASRARNLGAAAAAGEVLLFTDDDCLVPVSWVADHLDALADPAIAASFGVVAGLSRTSGDDPVARDLVLSGRVAPWLVGHGSNMAIRRAVLADTGGWDERLGPGTRLPAGEDADLIARILLAGHSVRTGVGDPVDHIAWRSEREDRRNVSSYEVGAGVWVGKALRAHGWAARGYVRMRLAMLWRSARLEPTVPARARLLVSRTAAFGWGVCRGLPLE